MGRTLFLVTILAIFVVASGQDCEWDKDVDFPSPYPPLLMDLASWQIMRPVLVGGNRIVSAVNNATVVVACPGEIIKSLGVESVEGICAGGTLLDVGGTVYNMTDFACSARVDDAEQLTGGTCGNNNAGQEAQIGFTIPGYPFVEIIYVCFEPSQEITLYTKHIVHGENVAASDGNPDRPSFAGDDQFYTLNPNDCYLTAGQDIFFEQLTGDPDYIDLSSGVYFSRGHLSPNADFLTEMEADASFFYTNAVPQWQAYNGQNWAYLEASGRDIAAAHLYDFIQWQGPVQQLSVNDASSVLTPVYICDTLIPAEKLIPIPEQLWKVIYDPVRDLGLAVLTSNNPHEVEIPQVCTDLDCSTIDWLTIFSPTDWSRGYTYCCTVQDLKAAVPNAPDLPTAGLLLD